MEGIWFFPFVCICNLTLGFIFLLLFFIFLQTRKGSISFPSNGLKIFILTCCFPQAILITICSMALGVYYLMTNDTEAFGYKIGRLVLTYASQQVRLSLITIILDRIISTVYLEKYATYSSKSIIWISMILFSHCITFCYIIVTSFWLFTKDATVYAYTVHSITFLHFITLITCKFLHSKNKKLYEMLVYNISLKQRYQILENIKVLNILWCPILIFSVCGFFGPFTLSIYAILTKSLGPAAALHVLYNLSFIIITIKVLKENIRRQRTVSITGNQFILSPLGNNLPANISNDMYFKDLKIQWNK